MRWFIVMFAWAFAPQVAVAQSREIPSVFAEDSANSVTTNRSWDWVGAPYALCENVGVLGAYRVFTEATTNTANDGTTTVTRFDARLTSPIFASVTEQVDVSVVVVVNNTVVDGVSLRIPDGPVFRRPPAPEESALLSLPAGRTLSVPSNGVLRVTASAAFSMGGGFCALFPSTQEIDVSIPPLAPEDVRADVAGLTLFIQWAAPLRGPAPTGYTLRIAASPTAPPIVVLFAGAQTSIVLSLPPSTRGTFFAQVSSVRGKWQSDWSSPAPFTVVCDTPAMPTGLTGSVAGGIASARWNPVAGAASYVLQAGAAPGGAEIFNADVGNTTAVSASVPPGFSAYVQVIAVNECGAGPPSAPPLLLGQGTTTWHGLLYARHVNRLVGPVNSGTFTLTERPGGAISATWALGGLFNTYTGQRVGNTLTMQRIPPEVCVWTIDFNRTPVEGYCRMSDGFVLMGMLLIK